MCECFEYEDGDTYLCPPCAGEMREKRASLAALEAFVAEVEAANDEHRGTNSYLAEKIDAALTRLKKEVG